MASQTPSKSPPSSSSSSTARAGAQRDHRRAHSFAIALQYPEPPKGLYVSSRNSPQATCALAERSEGADEMGHQRLPRSLRGGSRSMRRISAWVDASSSVKRASRYESRSSS